MFKKYNGKHMSYENVKRSNHILPAIKLLALAVFYVGSIYLLYWFLIGLCGHAWTDILMIALTCWLVFSRGGHLFLRRRLARLKYYYEQAFLR